jgi:hypothetical protein
MATAGPSYANLISPLDPSSAVNAYSIQRQQALAQALQAQALTSATDDLPKNLPVMPKVGLGQGLVKLAQALMAGNASEAADTAAGNQQQQNMAGLLRAMGGQSAQPTDIQGDTQSAPQGAPQDATQGAPQAAQPSGKTALNPTGANPMLASLGFQLDQQGYLKSALEDSARTPEMKNNAAMGYTPQMQLAAKLAEANVKGEIDRKAGNQYKNYMTGETGMVPKLPENSQIVGQVAPNGSLPGGVSAVPGANVVQQANADTSARASASYKPEKVFNAQTGGYDFSTATNIADAAGGKVTNNNIRKAADVGSLPEEFNTPGYASALDKEIAQQKNPKLLAILQQERARMSASPSTGPMAAEPPAGFDKGQVNSQEELSKSYTTQKDAHQNAQTTNSYLGEIVAQANKAAVGPQSDKMQYVNGLLSLAGNERATDATTANNLLDKYSNQIVARLGGGGMGTDAARSILTSAYPSAKMNLPAIQEAVANIKGANSMTMARTNIVAPYGDNRDPVGYSQAARTFDANADPKIFQFMQMSPDQKAAFKAKMSPPEMADFRKRGAALDSLGVKFK